MAQSNLSAVVLALLGISALGSGGLANTSTLLLVVDSVIGLEMFRRGNMDRIQ